MKLLTFRQNGLERLGWLQEDGRTVLSVDPNDTNMPQSIMDLIGCDPYPHNQLSSASDRLEQLNLDELELLPPIPAQGIFCVGMNYSDHAKEVGATPSEYPILFWRLPRNHVSPNQPLWTPKHSKTLDWEGELVAVIGKGGRHIQTEDALSHVFGYSIYMEGTVRGYLNHTSQLGMGKNFQASASFGPCIVTSDEFGNPYEHGIKTVIDGEIVQDGSIDLMLHRIEEVIAYISQGMELRPGDIICTGTPGGVGGTRTPPRYLENGQTVEVTIDGIGTLSNPVQDEPMDLMGVTNN